MNNDYKTENLWFMKGDCLERMKEIPDGSVDMIMTDPPYQITACKWDSIIPLDLMWEQLKRIIKPSGAIVMTASQPFTSILVSSNLKMFKYCWVWDKSLPTGFQMAKKRPLKQHEDVVIFYAKQSTYNPEMTEREKPRKYNRGDCSVGGETLNNVKHDGEDRVLTHYYPRSIIKMQNANNKGKVHPTQKPITLMEYMIKTYTNEGETVLDFTAGSFTTGVACVNLNRKFIGIEMDDNYYDIGTERVLSTIRETHLEGEH